MTLSIFRSIVEQGTLTRVMDDSRQVLIEVMGKGQLGSRYCIKAVLDEMEKTVSGIMSKVNASVEKNLKKTRSFLNRSEWKKLNKEDMTQKALHTEYRGHGFGGVFESRLPSNKRMKPRHLLLYNEFIDPWVKAQCREIRQMVKNVPYVIEEDIKHYLEIVKNRKDEIRKGIEIFKKKMGKGLDSEMEMKKYLAKQVKKRVSEIRNLESNLDITKENFEEDLAKMEALIGEIRLLLNMFLAKENTEKKLVKIEGLLKETGEKVGGEGTKDEYIKFNIDEAIRLLVELREGIKEEPHLEQLEINKYLARMDKKIAALRSKRGLGVSEATIKEYLSILEKYFEEKLVKHEKIKEIVGRMFEHYQSIRIKKKDTFKKKDPLMEWAESIAMFITGEMKDYEAFLLAEGGTQEDPVSLFSCKVAEFAKDLVCFSKKTSSSTLESISEESEEEHSASSKALLKRIEAAVEYYPRVSKETLLEMAEGKIDEAIFKAYPDSIVAYFNERLGEIKEDENEDLVEKKEMVGLIALLQAQKSFEKVTSANKSLTGKLKGLKANLDIEEDVIKRLLCEMYFVRNELEAAYRKGKKAGIFTKSEGKNQEGQSLDEKFQDQIGKLRNWYSLIGNEAYPDEKQSRQSNKGFFSGLFSSPQKKSRRKSLPALQLGKISPRTPNQGSRNGGLSPRVSVSPRVQSNSSGQRGHRRGRSVSTTPQPEKLRRQQ